MSGSGSNEVGYGKPPKHTQFKKGQSGNPSGKKKKPKTLEQLLAAEAAKTTVVTIDGKKQKLSKAEVIVLSLVRRAMQGEVKAAQIVGMALSLQASVEDAGETTKPLTATEKALLVELLNSNAQEEGQ